MAGFLSGGGLQLEDGVGEALLNGIEESGGVGSVDEPVIVGQR
jgi:hypothetical protein